MRLKIKPTPDSGGSWWLGAVAVAIAVEPGVRVVGSFLAVIVAMPVRGAALVVIVTLAAYFVRGRLLLVVAVLLTALSIAAPLWYSQDRAATRGQIYALGRELLLSPVFTRAG